MLAGTAVQGQAPALELPIFHLSQGEWKGAVLTDSGRQIVADVARSAGATPVKLLDINGLADMGATPVAQKRLSDARAGAVRDELIRDGVQEGDIGLLIADRPDGSVPPVPKGTQKRVVIVVFY